MMNTAAVTMTNWRCLSSFSPGNNMRNQQQYSLLRPIVYIYRRESDDANRGVRRECASKAVWSELRLNIAVCDATPCVLVHINDSEERASSIFRVQHFLLNAGNGVQENMESHLTALRTSKSKSKLHYDWRFTTNQFVLASSPLRLNNRDFLTESLRS
jgi:hypothetical protein